MSCIPVLCGGEVCVENVSVVSVLVFCIIFF